MSSKIYKNFQVNVGIPFNINNPMGYQPIKFIELEDEGTDEEVENTDISEDNSEDIIEKAREEAELIIKEAHYEAMRLLETAQKEADEGRQFIYEEAQKAGYEEGISQAKRQYEDLIQEAEFISEHAKTEYKEVLAGIESEAVSLILEIAKSVIGTEISFNKEDILYLVKQAFEKCSNKDSAVLKVSPEDYDYTAANKDRLLAMIEGMGELEVKKDASLKPGACIIETPFGSIDAGVQTKLQKIEEAFRNAIGK